ncbi:MAG: copper-translocating P-type ATPase [Lachnospiraceae bacterium]|nr:copper-translocating P-type ATPase [Lachnospiraceae bacterium]
MSCAACSAAVERVTRKLEGVERSDVNLTTNRMTIYYDEAKVTPELIMSKVEKAGFGIRPYVKENIKVEKEQSKDKSNSKSTNTSNRKNSVQEKELEALKNHKRNLISAAMFTILLLYVSMGQMLVDNLPIPPFMDMDRYPTNFALTQLLLTVPVLWFGRKFFIVGFNALFHMNPNMDSLVAIGSAASFIYSIIMTYMIPMDAHHVHHLYYESAATVITLVMFGKYLEGNSKLKTKGAITKLMELAPDVAILENGTEVPTESLKPGDVVVVKPGAKIPLDGMVIKGDSGVNESMITGESIPVEKTIGSNVIGGSININGVLYVKITRVGEDTTLAKIIKFVENAQGKKAPISKLADRVAGIFVPAVIIIAVVASIIWAITGQDVQFVLRIFTSVLVIACPCSLGLATPTAIMVGTGLGASNGILIRNGEILEIAHKIDTVVLDKTGTITEGKPSVREIVAENYDRNELLKLAGTVENVSEHPLGRAVTEAAYGQCEEGGCLVVDDVYEIEEFNNHSGMGIVAKVINHSDNDSEMLVAIGNNRLMEYKDIISSEKLKADAERLASEGQTPLMIAVNGEAVGIISVADTIKETSREAVEALKKEGIHVVMLTGDNKGAAEAIGKQAGVDEIIAEVMPEDKANVVVGLQEKGAKVMMVGDGINDAPALTQADVGCAIGNGSDIAIESGDIVLMKSDLMDVSAAIRLSRLTITNIKENLFWAFLYNTIGIPIAAGLLYPISGLLLSPMFGGFAMSLSSVCVVTNALRLKTKKLRK